MRAMLEIESPLADTKLIEFDVITDHRGSFSETYNKSAFDVLGISNEFVQDNEAISVHRGTLRGLHVQLPPHAQGKLVRVLRGAIFDVVVDLRPDSSTYREHASVILSGNDRLGFWIPPGFAHGYCTLESDTVVVYKTTARYSREAERSIRFDDPSLGIAWPMGADSLVISDKDAAAPLLSEIEQELRCEF
jgi:dTDP-4-dehydrorhamnose 3,5-epimerase